MYIGNSVSPIPIQFFPMFPFFFFYRSESYFLCLLWHVGLKYSQCFLKVIYIPATSMMNRHHFHCSFNLTLHVRLSLFWNVSNGCCCSSMAATYIFQNLFQQKTSIIPWKLHLFPLWLNFLYFPTPQLVLKYGDHRALDQIIIW